MDIVTRQVEQMYYGRHEPEKPPRLGVIYVMIDDHIKGILNKCSKSFSEQLGEMLVQFKKESLEDIKEIKKKISLIQNEVVALKKAVSNEKKSEMDQVKESMKARGLIKEEAA